MSVQHSRPRLHRFENLFVSELNTSLWQEWLRRTPHDLFHTGPYHRVQSEPDGATAYLAIYGNRDKFVALPYILKPIPTFSGVVDPRLREVSSVYGYSGPVAYNCQNDLGFFSNAWKAISRQWADQGAVSAFIRFHPILGNASSFEHGSTVPNAAGPDGDIALVGNTVAIDLSKDPDSIWYGYSRQIRQAVRRCSSHGIIVKEDAGWEYLEDFIEIYHRTMKRNHADDFYFFTSQYLRSLKDVVGHHARLMVARHESKVASAAVLLEYGGIVNLYLLATDDEYLHLSPSKAVVHASQEWAKARGNRTFHLGGGRGGRSNEPLFQFKAAFSNQFLPFYVGRWILDTSAYSFLTEQRKKEAANLECKEVDPLYFPAYRAPALK